MKREGVSSSAVSSIGYDDGQRTLEVEFRAGAVYRYFGVPRGAHRALMHAPSIGTHMNRAIKPNFRYARVPPDEN